MNFEYDFKDGHTRFSTDPSPGEVLDEKRGAFDTGNRKSVSVAANANQDGKVLFLHMI